MAKARKYVLRSHFSGLPKREDLEIVEEVLPALQDGGTTEANKTDPRDCELLRRRKCLAVRAR